MARLMLDVVTARELVLSGARLAGAADWSLRIPPQETVMAEAGKLKVGQQLLGTPINLLVLDAPTKMVTWNLTTIRVPIAVAANTGAAEPASVEAVVTLNLRRGGDIVWSQSAPIIMPKATIGHYFGNATMGADLQNPVNLPTGKSLTLDAGVSYSAEQEPLGGLVRLGVGQERTGVLAPETRSVEGFIAYNTVKGTGHREL